MEITKSISNWGNSAGVLLPKEWSGKEARIILIDRTAEIKKEVFDIVDDYLPDILGIYLVGSYARREQNNNSDIDLLIISKNITKEIVSGKYHVSIITLENLKKSIKRNPILVLPRLMEAETIINSLLIEEFRDMKFNKNSFSEFIEETKRIIKINKGLLEMGNPSDYIDSNEIVYSLILRLRGIYLARCLIERKKYLNKNFLKWLKDETKEDSLEEVYGVYRNYKDNKKSNKKIKTEAVNKLMAFLEKEVKNW